MFKAEVTNDHVMVNISSSLPQLCSELTKILSAVNKRISEQDAEGGHQFRVMMTTGFMDGICFDDDKEHMEHYLAEGRNAKKEAEENHEEFADFLNGFIDFLKDKLETLGGSDNETK